MTTHSESRPQPDHEAAEKVNKIVSQLESSIMSGESVKGIGGGDVFPITLKEGQPTAATIKNVMEIYLVLMYDTDGGEIQRIPIDTEKPWAEGAYSLLRTHFLKITTQEGEAQKTYYYIRTHHSPGSILNEISVEALFSPTDVDPDMDDAEDPDLSSVGDFLNQADPSSPLTAQSSPLEHERLNFDVYEDQRHTQFGTKVTQGNYSRGDSLVREAIHQFNRAHAPTEDILARILNAT